MTLPPMPVDASKADNETTNDKYDDADGLSNHENADQPNKKHPSSKKHIHDKQDRFYTGLIHIENDIMLYKGLISNEVSYGEREYS